MKTFLILSFSLLIVSCKENDSTKNEIVEKAAENTESSFPIKRMGNSQNILDGIYSELIKNDSQLKKLDEKVASIQNDSRIIEKIYDDVIKNSTDYYILADNAKTISDSVLKREILKLVNNSSEKFKLKKDKIEELKRQVRFNNYKTYSFYQALKIRRTLPEIEKYQKANPLKSDSLSLFIIKQNQLLSELKNIK